MRCSRELWAEGADFLAKAGIESARLDARVLFAHVLGIEANEFLSSRTATPEQEARYRELLERRAAHEPTAYITGEREFWSHSFAVGPGVLIPRPETETLIEEASRRISDHDAPLDVLDLGTGSGCLLFSFLKSYPNATGIGIDMSLGAIEWAQTNAEQLGVSGRCELRREEWSRVDSAFDLILCNPPYVARRDASNLQADVAFEPEEALFGGEDGLDSFRALAPVLMRGLKPDGIALVEIGGGQSESVRHLFETAGLEILGVTPDLAGIPRCVTAALPRLSFGTRAEKTVGNVRSSR